MKGYKSWDPENKKIVLSKHVIFDETSLLKSTAFQQMEMMNTKHVSLWSRLMLLNHLQLVQYQLGSHRM